MCPIAVGPVMDVPPISMNVSATETITLTCVASGFPVPNVTWFVNESQVSC